MMSKTALMSSLALALAGSAHAAQTSNADPLVNQYQTAINGANGIAGKVQSSQARLPTCDAVGCNASAPPNLAAPQSSGGGAMSLTDAGKERARFGTLSCSYNALFFVGVTFRRATIVAQQYFNSVTGLPYSRVYSATSGFYCDSGWVQGVGASCSTWYYTYSLSSTGPYGMNGFALMTSDSRLSTSGQPCSASWPNTPYQGVVTE